MPYRLVLILTLACGLASAPSLAGPEAGLLADLAYDEALAANSPRTEPAARLRHWERALDLTEQALAVSDSLGERVMILGYLSERAFNAGQAIKASHYADRALREFRQLDDQPYAQRSAAETYHHAHLVLGQLALLDDDLVVAIEHLHAAARTMASPAMKSFGPNMALARELLMRGERQAVLDYFDLCGEFWSLGVEGGTLDEWAAIVRLGGIPEFRGNLIYGQ